MVWAARPRGGLIPGMQHELRPEVWIQWAHCDIGCDEENGSVQLHPIVLAPGLLHLPGICLDPTERTPGSD